MKKQICLCVCPIRYIRYYYIKWNLLNFPSLEQGHYQFDRKKIKYADKLRFYPDFEQSITLLEDWLYEAACRAHTATA